MKIRLPISSIFLRQRLAFTRRRLLGVEKNPQVNVKEIKTVFKKGSRFSSWILFIICLFTLSLAVFIFAPSLYFSFVEPQTEVITPIQEGTPIGGDFDQKNDQIQKYQPEKNESLPEGNWLVIPRIGVRSEMRKTATAEEAMAEGIWWVPDFGGPGDDLPIILVAHRYGYQWWWKTDYWKYNSFYLLPDLIAGDIIEVISDQRKWTYEVYQAEEGEQITDYDADLILYTCKYLNSPIKHFRYARLINPEVDTQK